MAADGAVDFSSVGKVSPAAVVKYTERRAKALVGVAQEACRLVSLQLWWVAINCMRDFSGAEIERHLDACRQEFRELVLTIALRKKDGRPRRTWASWRARRLATIAIFLAYLCQRSSYHGAVVWMVRGIPKGVLAVATTMRSCIAGKEIKHRPQPNTVWSDLDELKTGGLLLRDQFAWFKVPAWCRGRARALPDGKFMQWSFNYYFLTVCPFPSGTEGRLVPAPRGAPIKRTRQRHEPRPQVTIDVEAELAQAEAAQRRAIELNRLDAMRGQASLGDTLLAEADERYDSVPAELGPTRAQRQAAVKKAHDQGLQHRQDERAGAAATRVLRETAEELRLKSLLEQLTDSERKLLEPFPPEQKLVFLRAWRATRDEPEPKSTDPP